MVLDSIRRQQLPSNSIAMSLKIARLALAPSHGGLPVTSKASRISPQRPTVLLINNRLQGGMRPPVGLTTLLTFPDVVYEFRSELLIRTP